MGRLSIRRALCLPAFLLLLVVRTPAAADPVDDYVRLEMQRRQIPGLALAVVRHGAVVKLGGYGFANLEHDVPVTADTVFELASVTKQFTAAAVMALVEEAKVRLDEPVGSYLAGTPDSWRRITVRHLLKHTSGLPGLEDNFKALWPGGLRLSYSTAQLFDAATKDAVSFPAGERFQYSNVGYVLLGMIIERTSGKRYAENNSGLTYGIAGRYLPGLHVAPEPTQPDPDPAATVALRETLGRLARGDDDPRILPVRKLYFPPAFRRALAQDLATLTAFTFVTCDDTRTRLLERHGERVSRVCHYRFVNATATYYYSFWLLPDGRIADIRSSTE